MNHTIEGDTPIRSDAIADQVISELETYLGSELPQPEHLASRLCEQASSCYSADPCFRRLVRRSGNQGRDWLYSFMRHWLSGLVKDYAPELFRRIPYEFKIGSSIHATAKRAT